MNLPFRLAPMATKPNAAPRRAASPTADLWMANNKLRRRRRQRRLSLKQFKSRAAVLIKRNLFCTQLQIKCTVVAHSSLSTHTHTDTRWDTQIFIHLWATFHYRWIWAKGNCWHSFTLEGERERETFGHFLIMNTPIKANHLAGCHNYGLRMLFGPVVDSQLGLPTGQPFVVPKQRQSNVFGLAWSRWPRWPC